MTHKPPKLGQSFEELKQKAREIPEVKEYLNNCSVVFEMGVVKMLCPICSEEMEPTDILESPSTGVKAALDYECPDRCEYYEYLINKENGMKEIIHET